MGTAALNALVFVAAFVAMEGVAWATHKYVMHGWLWCWHRSHHEPHEGALERNDLFALLFSVPAVVMIWMGVHVWSPWLWAGLGVTAYGAAYFLFHDGLVHRRYPFPFKARRRYWRRLVQAHRLHHAVRDRDGAVAFGFLWSTDPRVLKAELAARRRKHAASC